MGRPARAELHASGETIGHGALGGERLTPQESQIALLVTQGRTNAEIGRAIFLSTRTVEFHLSRVYRKLGISSRTELAGRLLGTGQHLTAKPPDVSTKATRQNSLLCAAVAAGRGLTIRTDNERLRAVTVNKSITLCDQCQRCWYSRKCGR
jgi:DNA-binding CsgD family transcriptional regulator